MTQRSRAALLTALGVAALGGAWLAAPPVRYAAFALGIALLFLAATRVGTAGRAADRLARFRDRPVDVRVWGAPLPDAPPEGFQLLGLRTSGAGLHLQLRSRGGDGSLHALKVAQPTDVAIDQPAGRATIGEAKYVQWRRQQLPHPGSVANVPALELRLLAVREGGEASTAAAGPGMDRDRPQAGAR